MMEIAIWKNREDKLINNYFLIINSFKQHRNMKKDQINKLSTERIENLEKVEMKH